MKRGQHKSLCNAGDRSVKWLEAFECVQKVILGRSESCRHSFSPGTLRLSSNVDAGFKIKIYGGKGITDGYLYIAPEHRPFIQSEVQKRFGV